MSSKKADVKLRRNLLAIKSLRVFGSLNYYVRLKIVYDVVQCSLVLNGTNGV